MAIIIVGKNQDIDKTFKPIVINLTITIETKNDLKELKEEFKKADLDDNYVLDWDDHEALSNLSNILQAVEKEL